MHRIATSLMLAGAVAMSLTLAAVPASAKSATIKECKSHNHTGVSEDKNKTKAYRGSFHDWSEKVKIHDGVSWSSTKTSSGTKFSSGCSKVYEYPNNPNSPWHWRCTASAKPCKTTMTIVPLTKPMPPLLNKAPWTIIVPRSKSLDKGRKRP